MLLISLLVSGQTFNVLQITDIHYDEMYTPTGSSEWGNNFCRVSTDHTPPAPFSRPGCDSSWLLVETAIQQARLVAAPDILIISGDIAAHKTEPDMKIREFKKVAALISGLFEKTKTKILFCLGNNDVKGNYVFDHEFNIQAAEALKSLIPSESFESFRDNAYYHTWHHNTHFIVINTLAYTTHDDEDRGPDPYNQFAFLETQLRNTRDMGGVAMLIGHIFPSHVVFHQMQMWKAQYVDSFIVLMKNYRDVIAHSFWGHVHKDIVRIIFEDDDVHKDPIMTGFIAPSISASNLNNPAFSAYEIDFKSGIMYDAARYFIDLHRANYRYNKDKSLPRFQLELKYSKDYGFSQINKYTMRDFVHGMFAHLLDDRVNRISGSNDISSSREMFDKYFAAVTVQWLDGALHYCTITRMKHENFIDCLNTLDDKYF
ncbi:hypothetical protein PCE1_003255 [Barthelona sp. PCE]